MSEPMNVENHGIMMIETPVNMLLSGCYGLSHAYRSLKDRMPAILAKVIDTCSRKKNDLNEEDIKLFIAAVSKLRYSLQTNKQYEKLSSTLPDTESWNHDIEAQEIKFYFNNNFLFTECYVYRKMWDECSKLPTISGFDYFSEMKDKSLDNSIEPMCLFADKLLEMLQETDINKREENFLILLQFCLWGNNSDMSLSGGQAVTPGGQNENQVNDPIAMLQQLKDRILVNDSISIYNGIVHRAEEMDKNNRNTVFDIVSDNAGYELFADLCLALFLIEQKIVQKVRFHLKNVPWFVSDAMPHDFRQLIVFSAKAKYERSSPKISSHSLKRLGEKWSELVNSKTFEIHTNDFWTSAHVYKDMKVKNLDLYKKLQSAITVMFKGDLNYRKLLGELRVVDTISFQDGLQGFHPAPVMSVRTVKCEIVCGLPPDQGRRLADRDWRWMENGDYGVIQYSPKIRLED